MDLNDLTHSMSPVETEYRHTLQHDMPLGVRRRKNRADPTYSQVNATFERRDMTGSEEERDRGKVLTFHGLILRSQLAEMFKHKIFFNESDGVSGDRLTRLTRTFAFTCTQSCSHNPKRYYHTLA